MTKPISLVVIWISVAVLIVSLSSHSLALEDVQTSVPQNTVSFGTMDPSALVSDPRLREAKVTITEPEIYIGELLERISKQTGVPLKATDRYHTAGWRICVSLKGKSLADTMNALRSAMSFKNAFWTWQRTKTPDGFQYELVGSGTQSQFEEAVRKNVQDDFLKRWEEVKAAIEMTQEERDQAAEGSAAHSMQGKRGQLGIKMLTTDLPPGELNDLLHGTKTSLAIPYQKLGEQGKKFVDFTFNEHNQLQIQHGLSANDSVSPGIVVSLDRFSNKITPSLMILLDGGGFTFGYTYIGGTAFEKKSRLKLEAEYLLRDDSATSPITSAKILEPADKDKQVPDFDPANQSGTNDGPSVRVTPFLRRFEQLSAVELEGNPSFSFIACLSQPEENMPTLDSPYDKTLGKYITRLTEFGIGSKWNSGILLLRYLPGVTRGDSETTPSYEMIRWAKDHYHMAPDGELSLDELIHLCTNWTSKEMLRAPKEQFPYLHSLATDSGGYYKALGKQPKEILAALQSPQGLPSNQLSPTLATLFGVDYPTTRSKTLRARLFRTHRTKYGNEVTEYFDIFDPSNPIKPLHQVGFGVSLPPPPVTKK